MSEKENIIKNYAKKLFKKTMAIIDDDSEREKLIDEILEQKQLLNNLDFGSEISEIINNDEDWDNIINTEYNDIEENKLLLEQKTIDDLNAILESKIFLSNKEINREISNDKKKKLRKKLRSEINDADDIFDLYEIANSSRYITEKDLSLFEDKIYDINTKQSTSLKKIQFSSFMNRKLDEINIATNVNKYKCIDDFGLSKNDEIVNINTNNDLKICLNETEDIKDRLQDVLYLEKQCRNEFDILDNGSINKIIDLDNKEMFAYYKKCDLPEVNILIDKTRKKINEKYGPDGVREFNYKLNKIDSNLNEQLNDFQRISKNERIVNQIYGQGNGILPKEIIEKEKNKIKRNMRKVRKNLVSKDLELDYSPFGDEDDDLDDEEISKIFGF